MTPYREADGIHADVDRDAHDIILISYLSIMQYSRSMDQ